MSNIINIQSIIANEIKVSDARNMVILHKGETYTFFDEGTSRHVFVNPENTKVIKIEKNSATTFNKEEEKIYNTANDEDKALMVETVLYQNVIEQAFCTPIKFGGRKLTPEQRAFANSCRSEVGWDNDGTLKCFDLDEFKKY